MAHRGGDGVSFAPQTQKPRPVNPLAGIRDQKRTACGVVPTTETRREHPAPAEEVVMRAAMVQMWKSRHGDRCGAHASRVMGQAEGHGPHEALDELRAGPGGGGFGVRRPLRFLSWKLELSEIQITELASILDELKTERAQAAVDDRRALTAFAEALGADTFDEAKVKSGAASRTKSAERLQGEVARALSRIHALLDPEQRTKLAYMIRTGMLAL